MNQHINIEDYLEPTDPPLPLPAIETFKGTNTLDSTIEIGETMITQGYRIPLQIKQGAIAKTADIYIGNAPLTQGQTITKSQSNVDLELFSGDNIIDTTLVNKPQVDLTYLSSILGVGEQTTNLFNKVNCGLVQVNSQGTMRFGSILYDVENGEYTLACNNQSGRSLYLHTLTDDTYTTVNVTSLLPYTFTVQDIDALILRSTITEETDWDTVGVYDIMLVEGSTAPQTYIPYGYQIPLLITSGQQSTPHTIYIGDSPLTAGQSVNKTSSGADIALYQGNNTISTTLGNKPEMRIDYLSAEVGVGEPTKNLLEITATSTTISNVTFTVDKTAGTVTASNSASANQELFLEGDAKRSISDGRITNGAIMSSNGLGAGGRFVLSFYDASETFISGTQQVVTDTAQSVTISVPANAAYYRFYLRKLPNYPDTITFKPMLRKADTTSDFIPYGYQIPIQVKQRTGNLFNKDAPYTSGKYLNTSGEEVSGATWGISEFIPIEGDTTYTAYNLSGGGASACWYDENKNFISGENYGGATSKSFSLPSNAKYIRLTIRLLNSPNIDTMMLIKGNTAPEDYIPYYNIIEKDIYIGNSPLLEGQSVMKELLLEDIPTYNGETNIDTTLYNKPYSIIIPTNKAANIIKEIQKLWDAVKSINPSSQSNSIDIVKKRIKLSNNVDSPVIIENISDVKVYEEEDTQNSTNQESGDLI